MPGTQAPLHGVARVDRGGLTRVAYRVQYPVLQAPTVGAGTNKQGVPTMAHTKQNTKPALPVANMDSVFKALNEAQWQVADFDRAPFTYTEEQRERIWFCSKLLSEVSVTLGEIDGRSKLINKIYRQKQLEESKNPREESEGFVAYLPALKLV